MIYVENDGIIKKLSLDTPLQAIGTQLKVWEAVSDAPDPLQDALNALPYLITLLGDEVMKVAVISDTKTVGANGGTFTAGAWRQRDLNTIAQTDSIVSVSLNNITVLETGKYRIAGFAPATGVVYHQSRLVRNGVELAVGQAALCGSVPVNSIAPVVWCGALTAGDILQLQHRCSATYATYGMGGGEGVTWGNVVFSVVEIVQF